MLTHCHSHFSCDLHRISSTYLCARYQRTKSDRSFPISPIRHRVSIMFVLYDCFTFSFPPYGSDLTVGKFSNSTDSVPEADTHSSGPQTRFYLYFDVFAADFCLEVTHSLVDELMYNGQQEGAEVRKCIVCSSIRSNKYESVWFGNLMNTLS